jgi:hypothetical protein
MLVKVVRSIALITVLICTTTVTHATGLGPTVGHFLVLDEHDQLVVVGGAMTMLSVLGFECRAGLAVDDLRKDILGAARRKFVRSDGDLAVAILMVARDDHGCTLNREDLASVARFFGRP